MQVLDSTKPACNDREGRDALIKCEITIDTGKNGDLILQASMPKSVDAPEIEHVVAEVLKVKIGEWIDAMAPLGDLHSVEGTGAGADAIRKILKKEGESDGR